MTNPLVHLESGEGVAENAVVTRPTAPAHGLPSVGWTEGTVAAELHMEGATRLELPVDVLHLLKTADIAEPVAFEDDGIVVGAAKWLGATKVVGVHYDTFGYIKIDKEAAVEAFKKEGIELLLPGIGESFEL